MKTKILNWLNDVIHTSFTNVRKMYINLDAGVSSDGYRVHIHNRKGLPDDANKFMGQFNKVMNGKTKGLMMISSKYLLDALAIFDSEIVLLEIIEVEAKEGPGDVLYISDNYNENEAFIMSLKGESDE